MFRNSLHDEGPHPLILTNVQPVNFYIYYTVNYHNATAPQQPALLSPFL